MGLEAAKTTIKEIISFNLIDIEGSINTKGNYIHLYGTSKVNAMQSAFKFTITIAGYSLTGSDDSIEPLLKKALEDIFDYEVKELEDLDASSKVVKIGELLAYELKISIVDSTI